jgi:hypothetical protein
MRKLIVSEFITLDGVIQAPGGKDEDTDGGFAHGGWTHPFFDDTVGGAFDDALNGVSRTLTKPIWRNTTIIRENVIEAIRDLKAKPGKDILTDGSSQLVHAMLKHDLVDELHLLVYPIVVGGGKRLFPDGMRSGFKLTSTKAYPTGVVGLHYVRV